MNSWLYFQTTVLPVACRETSSSNVLVQCGLDSPQQPVWRGDPRLGKVVPPPGFLLPLHPSCISIAVPLKLVVGVESLPRLHSGEKVVVDVGFHGHLDEVKVSLAC